MSLVKPFAVLTLCLAAVVSPASLATSQTAERRPEWEQHDDATPSQGASVLLRFRDDVDADGRLRALERFDLSHAELIPGIDVWRADAPAVGDALATLCRQMCDDASIAFAEIDEDLYLEHVPTDPAYSSNYGHPGDLQRWVFDGVGVDRNLDAEAAWDVTRGDPSVVIAIVDSGVAYDHAELLPNVWTNPGEIPDNGIDDDANGYVDDVHGWDFARHRADPYPDLGDGIDNDAAFGADSNVAHGTMVASIAVARADDGMGMAGAAPLCRFMPIKVLTDDGGAKTSNVAAAFVYAVNKGAQVINVSLAGAASSTLSAAVTYARTHGALVVAAAGNDNSAAPRYPAAYPSVVSVGASDGGSVIAQSSGDIDGRAAFTEFGTAAVSVVAPGVALDAIYLRSVADGGPGSMTYRLASGTSFAAPLVSAAAALVLSRSHELGTTLGPADVQAILVSTAVDLPDDPHDVPDAGPNWDGHGRISYRRAVEAVPVPAPSAPPVADAGPDTTGWADFPVTFDASASSDPEGHALSYLWDFGDGATSDVGPVVGHVFAARGSYTVRVTVSDGEQSTSDTCEAVVDDRPQGPLFYLSFSGSTTLPGMGRVADEDIVVYDPGLGLYAPYFRGADVGLAGADVDAFTLLPDGSLLMSFDNRVFLTTMAGGPNGPRVEESDLVRFIPSSVGAVTAGRFVFYFDASDVGLTGPGSDVDAVALSPSGDGSFILSITGTVNLDGIGTITNHDLVRFVPTSLGSVTAGRWELFLRGGPLGLDTANEDVDALQVSPTGDIFLSTKGPFSIDGLDAADEDVLVLVPTRLGAEPAGRFHPYFTGAREGIPAGADVDGVFVKE
ncbi:MAG: S8 family serine peptidase [Planctomycetes bacterium]|nr:S8 family serine peptidase [Planctomycetota bacterium]